MLWFTKLIDCLFDVVSRAKAATDQFLIWLEVGSKDWLYRPKLLISKYQPLVAPGYRR